VTLEQSWSTVAPDRSTLLLTNFIPPYREEVFRHAHRLLGGRFAVCTLTAMERNRSWPVTRETSFTRRTLPGVQTFVKRLQLPLHVNVGVSRAIREVAPAVVVVTGFDTPAYWRAQQVCRADGRGFVFWSGTHASSGAFRSRLATAVRRYFVSRCDAYLAYGTLAAQFLCALGARPSRIVTSTNAVDTARFRDGIADREATREALGWSGRKVVMYSGRLIPQKGVEILIRAVARAGGDYVLAIVGDGPERPANETAARAALGARAVFLGNRPYSELPRIYAAADVFVLPSRNEVWGLVINEALAAGVPAIATDATGAAHDLIVPTGAGLMVAYGDEAGLANALRRILESDDERARMRIAARAAVEDRDCEAYARDLVRAVDMAASARMHGAAA
jgi:glycosyltransferase involved in cell wall biosynthesis